ncbi:hypothetical protein PO124_01605 [Bacillus licheniformis]|nr:hypothetical protein [Bacillus licheniformis]
MNDGYIVTASLKRSDRNEQLSGDRKRAAERGKGIIHMEVATYLNL